MDRIQIHHTSVTTGAHGPSEVGLCFLRKNWWHFKAGNADYMNLIIHYWLDKHTNLNPMYSNALDRSLLKLIFEISLV